MVSAQVVHPKIVQEPLEHADISMTLNRFSHMNPDMQRSGVDTLDAALGSSRPQGSTEAPPCDMIEGADCF
jgi:hypothetical protein